MKMLRYRSRIRASVLALGVVATLTAPVPAISAQFDHSQFDALLEKYVNSDGLVDYDGWKAKDTQALKVYLASLSEADPTRFQHRNERLAFWINAYNALTIDAILHFYPLGSIKEKVSRVFGYNVWDDYPLTVMGRAYSLNAIEHKILRPMHEPRIHFAIVCASIGCPKLQNEAYTGPRLNAQLEDNARHFFAQPDRLRLDRSASTVHVSPILEWFSEDFGGTDAAKLTFIRPFVKDETVRVFLEKPGIRISYLPYDWGLNKQ